MNLILIANRGEIAVRVMRTVQAMGYRALAVYSDADAHAPHVRMADCTCRIGPGPAAESYLNGAAILTAAQIHGADAVHPGYGFLAENAEFAQAVIGAGLTWIGPPPAAMRAMGNKAAAKRLLAGRDVPLLPGYQGEQQADAVLLAEAMRIGFPLMIKAAAGGGGRGMRLVHNDAELPASLAQARSEAQQAFGSGELILERALINPRHVEVQVFADAHGNVVHIGERDCSVQRRHQKIVEEAPSPAVSQTLRHRLGRAAIEATRSCGYAGAGTIEFLLDADGAFWFMEMNTRLQVEHPVTEAITGLDLVEWQLRVASGEHLPLTQEQIDARLLAGGHAMEVRLCAEDPVHGFLPQTGKIALWRAPQGVRVEHALESGQEISPHYDSMVAKLIAHAPTREQVVRSLHRQLDQCLLLGVPTNQDFLLDVLAHPEFIAGNATTGFVGEHLAQLPTADADAMTQAVACALLLQHRGQATVQPYPPELRGWCSSAPFEDKVRLEFDGVTHAPAARALAADEWAIRRGSDIFNIAVTASSGHEMVFRVGDQVLNLQYCVDGEWIWLRCDGRNHKLRDLTYQAPQAAGSDGGDGMLRAPMNGKIAALPIVVGQLVQAGQTLVVLEAMKMEHAMIAPFGGVLRAVHVSFGEQVAPGKILLEITKS
jgi:geranyl-CoA carboxylase alpha subunit